MSKSSKVTGRVFHRHLYPLLHRRLSEDRRFIQVLSGPRQVGKTTLARQIGEGLGEPVHYVSADELTLQDRAWLAQQWEIGRSLTRSRGDAGPALLMIDKVQKIAGWSETVKRLWDEDNSRIQLLMQKSCGYLSGLSSTSRTLVARVCNEKGFWMKCTPSCNTPFLAMISAG